MAVRAIANGYGYVLRWEDVRRDLSGRPIGLDPHGGQFRRTVKLELAGDCEAPTYAELHSRHSAEHGKKVKPITVMIEARCRKCGPCRETRAMQWRARAISEFRMAQRSLFGTLTVDPEHDAQIDALARLELSEAGVDFDRLSEAEKFIERCKIGGREITKYLKRLREGDTRHDRPDFRYLLVAEAHNGVRTSELKRNRPHWHILLHEMDLSHPLVLPDEWATSANGVPLTDRYGNSQVGNSAFLKAQWRLGHSSFALCRTVQAAAYVCKYLTKEDAQVRIRASGRYGRLLPAPEAVPAA